MLDLTTLNLIVWGCLAAITALSLFYTLFRKRDIQLDGRVRTIVFGMMLAWIGNSVVPFEVYMMHGSIFISTFLISTGGLIITQMLLEWKFGRWVWLKSLTIAVTIGLFMSTILYSGSYLI